MRKNKILCLLTVLLVMGMFCIGYAAEKAEVSKSAEPASISFDLCPSVQITNISYYMKKYKGAPRLHFDISIKNISKEDKRFRLAVFLPDGVAGGGLYPRKGKPPVIKAGEELKRVFPMYFHELPTEFSIMIQEL
ncbi:MAG: hypothetical protein J7L57_07640 [Deltaproteobacteria bacterium]|nr:hypothetical protein [Candidatus Tharpella sp.]